jgi:hypothetical protein
MRHKVCEHSNAYVVSVPTKTGVQRTLSSLEL